MLVSDAGPSCATAVSTMMMIPIRNATAATARARFVRVMSVWFGLL
jgi:hypothetical protein